MDKSNKDGNGSLSQALVNLGISTSYQPKESYPYSPPHFVPTLPLEYSFLEYELDSPHPNPMEEPVTLHSQFTLYNTTP